MPLERLLSLFREAGLAPIVTSQTGSNYVVTTREPGTIIRAAGSDTHGRALGITVRTGSPHPAFLAASVKVEPADPEAIGMLLDLYASRDWNEA